MRLAQVLKNIEDYDDPTTHSLYAEFKSLNKKKYLTRKELLKILKWKSPRPLRHYEKNTEKQVRLITSIAFSQKSDAIKMHILTALYGVNYPAASAILMFRNPKKYPVLDIRVWQQLHKAKLVTGNPRGLNFTLQQCEDYFTAIRKLARSMGMTARQVEKRIFDYNRKTRKGRLYT